MRRFLALRTPVLPAAALLALALAACSASGSNPPTSSMSPTAPTPSTGVPAISASPLSVAPPSDTPAASLGSGVYTVNGHRLELDCQGAGSPTVVLEAGNGAPLGSMGALQQQLAEHLLVCAYSRPLLAEVRTEGDAVSDLHALLAIASVPGPYVLVGQSVGGLLVQLYARTYPSDVVGVVAMNSGPPCAPWLAALPKLGNKPLLADETAVCGGAGDGEQFDGNASWLEEQAAPAPPDVPFELVISTSDQDWCPPDATYGEPFFATREQCLRGYAIHESIARDIVAAWPQGHFSELDAPHELFATKLDAVVKLVRDVVARAPKR